jgi:heme oxygenase (mycobilin-producing)
MTVVKINAITVPAESGDELARRFAARAGAVDDADGFEGFELLKPTDGRTTWLVVTRWRDDEAFNAWLTSSAFVQGHAHVAGQSAGAGHGHGAAHSERQAGAEGDQARPVGTGSELWSFAIAGGSADR